MSAISTIALDAMGGDRAPQVVIAGADMARQRVPDLSFLLCGDQPSLRGLLQTRRQADSIGGNEWVPAAGISSDDLSSVHADASEDCYSPVTLEVVVQSFEHTTHLAGGSDSPKCVVLV